MMVGWTILDLTVGLFSLDFHKYKNHLIEL